MFARISAAAILALSTYVPASAVDFGTAQLQAELAELYPQTTARPLFSPDRRAAPEPVVAKLVEPTPEKIVPATYTPPPPRLTVDLFHLRGVVVAGDERIAILEHGASGATFRVKPGLVMLPDANGAEMEVLVSEILPQSVTLEAEEALTLNLRRTLDLAQPVVAEPADRATIIREASADAAAKTVVKTEMAEKYLAPLTPTAPQRLRRVRVVALDE